MKTRSLLLGLTALFVFAVSGLAETKAAKAGRNPANALTIDLKGTYMSPSNDNGSIELHGKDIKTHLSSRFSNENGKPIALRVKLECSAEDSCTLLLPQ